MDIGVKKSEVTISELEPWRILTKDMPSRSRELFDILRNKWCEVPAGLADRKNTNEFQYMSDRELTQFWSRALEEATTGEGFKVRGWFHHLYSDILTGKKVLDVGSGLGLDGITFARNGAKVTFVDIVLDNLETVKRLCENLAIKDVDFLHMEDFDSLERLPNDFDVIWCQGSMINAPYEFMRRECSVLLNHLKVGGRWIELCYPRERWVREGKLAFNEWGKVTDGESTPWMEWYDLDRLLKRMQPSEFEVLLHFNFHNDDFNWFDLIKKN